MRYVWSDTLRAHGWFAPGLCFGAIEAIICAHTGSVLPTYASSATVLLFISTWITVVTVNNEDQVQQSITVVTAGSANKVRFAKLYVAFLVGAGLGLLGLLGPLLATSFNATIGDIAAGAAAQLLTVLSGVAVGALLSRPVVTKRAWSVLLGFGVCLATVVVPFGPPARQILALFNATNVHALGLALLLIGLETAAISAAAVSASLRLARTRS